MVINESALARQMKAAYNSGGYILAMRYGYTAIMCGAWLVEIKDDHVPREALSLMALHLGFLPEEGEAYRIMKGDAEPSVQDMIFDTAIKPLLHFEKAMKEAENAPRIELRKTLLTFDGWNLWQKRGNGGMILLNPEYEAILRKKEDALLVEDALYKAGDFSKVFIMRGKDEKHEGELNHLGKYNWVQ